MSVHLPVVQRQFMSLVGQYDMDLFTTIFGLLFVPVPGFSLGTYDPLQVRTRPPSSPSLSPSLSPCLPLLVLCE